MPVRVREIFDREIAGMHSEQEPSPRIEHMERLRDEVMTALAEVLKTQSEVVHDYAAKQASMGLYLQALRASVKAAREGYRVGEVRALEAVLADLERALQGHWPIEAERLHEMEAELKEGGCPE